MALHGSSTLNELKKPSKVSKEKACMCVTHNCYSFTGEPLTNSDDNSSGTDSVKKCCLLTKSECNKVLCSLNTQIELLQHELLLAKHQVEERNNLVNKLENLIQSGNHTMKHLCEDPSLNQAIKLIEDAIHMQNEQANNMVILKRRIEALEVPQTECLRKVSTSCCNKEETYCPLQKIDKNDRQFSSTEQTSPPKTLVNAATNTCEPQASTTSVIYSGTGGEELLAKERALNGHLKQHLQHLEAESRRLETVISTLNEKNLTMAKTIEEATHRERNTKNYVSDLQEQNEKLKLNIRKIDSERDRVVKELDCTEESLAKLKTQLEESAKQVLYFESQFNLISEKKCKLEELLDSSEKIVNESKRQTMELAKEFGKTTAKLSSLEKSYDTLKFKHRHCSKHLKRYKKELLDSNDEKKVLQSQLQEYVNKVRIIEDMLLQKEQEREFVFEQFKGMSEKNVCKDIGTSVGTNASPESNYEEDLSNETVSKEVNCLPYSVYDLKLNGLHQELMTERRTSKHLHDVIKTTREEAMMTNRENEELTKQLSAMRMSVQNLEDKIKTIAESLDTYHGEPCHETNENDVSKVRIYCTGEKSESSHSTML